MNYIDVSELCEIFSSDEVNSIGDGNEWRKLIRLAQIKVDEVTFGRINGVGFDRLTPFQRDCVKKATAYQAKYIAENGYDESDISSYKVGDISISVGKGESSSRGRDIDPVAYSLLKQSNLMYRGC